MEGNGNENLEEQKPLKVKKLIMEEETSSKPKVEEEIKKQEKKILV